MGFCDRGDGGVRKERGAERREEGGGGGGERENPGTPGSRTARVKRGKNRDAPDWHEGLRLRFGNLAGFGEALKLQMRIMDISL